jgi:23S rRNA (uracil1939-C5)-methyltransferase/tRNA (uracil-5-)-methyltransferase
MDSETLTLTPPARHDPPGSMLVGRELEVEIHALEATGTGVGTAAGAAPDGLLAQAVIRVPFTLPGERVRARIWRAQGQEVAADLLGVTRASPARVAPGCALFGICGGCQVQHLAPTAQLAWKTALVRTALGPAGLAGLVRDCIPSPRVYGYRSKLTPHYEVPRGREAATDAAPAAIGFLRAGHRHALVDVPRCPLATDGVNAALPALRAAAHEAARGRRRGASLLLREGAGGVTSDPDARVVERVGTLNLEFAAREFFQNNPFLLPALVDFVIDGAASSGATLLVDTYSGSGLFALAAARRFRRVLGVEVSTAAVAAARANALANGLANVEFLAAPAARIFASVVDQGQDAAVIVDPPRKGADGSFLGQLVTFAPRTVVYVSCNPETAARDLAHLAAAGFAVVTVQPFDMFPQTRHVESVTVLHRA